MAFEKERHTKGNVTYETLFPYHEIDSYNGEEVKTHIRTIINAVDAVIIDFSRVAYLNSSGLRELIQILKLAQENKKRLMFSNLTPDMMRVFVHTNLDKLFTFYGTLEEAVDAL